MQNQQSSYLQRPWPASYGLADQWENIVPTPEFEATTLEEYDENIKGPLLNCLWGQGIGFNTFTPNEGCTNTLLGPNTYTGCVPTAIAQIMHYHQHPANLNFSIMPNRLYSTGPQYNLQTPGQIAIAQLMVHIGNQCNVDYGCDKTSASGNIAPTAFALNNYTSSINLVDYNYQTVKNQIENNKPVYMNAKNERVKNYIIRWKIGNTKIRAFEYHT